MDQLPRLHGYPYDERLRTAERRQRAARRRGRTPKLLALARRRRR